MCHDPAFQDMFLFPCTRENIDALPSSNPSICDIVFLAATIPVTFLIDIVIFVLILLLLPFAIGIGIIFIVIFFIIFVAVNIITCCIPIICMSFYYKYTHTYDLVNNVD